MTDEKNKKEIFIVYDEGFDIQVADMVDIPARLKEMFEEHKMECIAIYPIVGSSPFNIEKKEEPPVVGSNIYCRTTELGKFILATPSLSVCKSFKDDTHIECTLKSIEAVKALAQHLKSLGFEVKTATLVSVEETDGNFKQWLHNRIFGLPYEEIGPCLERKEEESSRDPKIERYREILEYEEEVQRLEYEEGERLLREDRREAIRRGDRSGKPPQSCPLKQQGTSPKSCLDCVHFSFCLYITDDEGRGGGIRD